MLLNILVIAGAYLWAGIPTSYLVARQRKGIDIRAYGSGNMGATNLMAQVGNRTGFLIGVYDCVGKGALPVLIAKLLGLDLEVQGLAGLAAIAGHNWSPFMRFSGGRGVATGIGVLLGLFLWYEMLILTVVLGLVGRLIFKETGFWTLVSIVLLPLLTYCFGRPVEVTYAMLGIMLLLILKRVMANSEPGVETRTGPRVIVNRILWDRDVSRKSEWLGRAPSPEGQGAAGDGGE